MNSIRLWWRAIRPFAYPASIIPALLGMTVAWSEEYGIDYVLVLLTLMGVVAVHTGANLMSDYFDFKRGIDRKGTLGGSGVMVEGLLTPRAILTASLIFFAIAGLNAIAIAFDAGFQIVWVVIGGLIAGVFYSLPPVGFKYGALGEVVVFLAFGIGITLGSYVVQTGIYSWTPVIYAIPFGLLVAAILHANNLRDVKSDLEVGVRTLVARFGSKLSKYTYTGMLVLAYVLVVIFVMSGKYSNGTMASLLTIPLATKLIKQVWGYKASGSELVGAAEGTAQLSLAFGLVSIVGIIVWSIIS